MQLSISTITLLSFHGDKAATTILQSQLQNRLLFCDDEAVKMYYRADRDYFIMKWDDVVPSMLAACASVQRCVVAPCQWSRQPEHIPAWETTYIKVR